MPSNILYKKCEWCGLGFTTIRPDARYHSDACRAAASRQRRRYQNGEPIPGLRGNFAAAADWVAKCSPESFRVLTELRKRRGLRAVEYAIVACLAICYPGIEEVYHEHHELYASLIDARLAKAVAPGAAAVNG